MLTFIKGKKTYIVAFLMVLIGVVHVVSGDTTLAGFLSTSSPDLTLILNGLGLGALRAGVASLATPQ